MLYADKGLVKRCLVAQFVQLKLARVDALRRQPILGKLDLSTSFQCLFNGYNLYL
jgi:hypothetical protein